MNCQQCRKWWSPYLDSELDAATTFQVSEHLRTCADCRERFEREAFVEQWLRDRLRDDVMPATMWETIRRDVQAKPRMLSFPLRRAMAVAASVAIIAVAGIYYAQQNRPVNLEDAPPATLVSVAEILQDRNPHLVPFPTTPEDDLRQQLHALSREMFNAVVDVNPAHSDGHPIELVSVSRQTDRMGQDYLEVRLNCCGRPVLLAMVQSGCQTCIPELRCATKNCKKRCRANCPKAPPIEMQSEERNGIMVAAATADHYLRGVFSAVSVSPI